MSYKGELTSDTTAQLTIPIVSVRLCPPILIHLGDERVPKKHEHPRHPYDAIQPHQRLRNEE